MSRRLCDLPGWDRVVKASEHWNFMRPSCVKSAGLWVPPKSIEVVTPELGCCLAIGIKQQRQVLAADRVRGNVVSLGLWRLLRERERCTGEAYDRPNTWKPEVGPYWLKNYVGTVIADHEGGNHGV